MILYRLLAILKIKAAEISLNSDKCQFSNYRLLLWDILLIVTTPILELVKLHKEIYWNGEQNE